MNTKRRVKVLVAVMSLAMIFAMMPQMGMTAYAAGKDSIQLVDGNGNVSAITGGQKSSIYYGNYNQGSDGGTGFKNEPIKWRVLSNSSGKLFLLSDMLLDGKQYDDEIDYVTWQDCAIRAWLNGNDGFKGTAFSGKEQAAIAVTNVVNKDNTEYNVPGGNNTKDQVFLLSISEAENKAYGFTPDAEDYVKNLVARTTWYAQRQGAGSGVCDWWLRSPGSYEGNVARAALAADEGFVSDYGRSVRDNIYGVRPAFNLDMKQVVFASSATGSKPGTVGAGSLKKIGSYSGSEWKMTVKDPAHQGFTVNSVTTSSDGKTVDIKYSGAVSGSGEYISAIVKKSDGSLKSYGRLAQASGTGTARVNIDGKMDAGDALYVFNEQCNGNYKTDYSSSLRKVKVKVTGTPVAKMTAKDKTGLTIAWNKIQGAEGYDIFFAKCNKSENKDACTLVKTMKGNKTLKWTKTKLKKNTAYMAYVRAYVTINGTKTYVKTSPVIHAYTTGGNKKFTNAKSVSVNKTKVTIKKNKTYKIKAKVIKLKKSKKLVPKSHAANLRYISSNTKIATVNGKGKITAKAKGSCNVYAYAHNGVWKMIKVTVK